PSWNEYYAALTQGLPLPDGGVNVPNPPTVDFPLYYWHAKLQPYVKNGDYTRDDTANNSGMWHCPDAGSRGEIVYFPNGTRYAFSYDYNGEVAYTNYPQFLNVTRWEQYYPGTRYYRWPKIAEMDQPTATIYVGDGGGYNGRIATPYAFNCYMKRL